MKPVKAPFLPNGSLVPYPTYNSKDILVEAPMEMVLRHTGIEREVEVLVSSTGRIKTDPE